MNVAKLTPWFPPSVKPARVGVYSVVSAALPAKGYSFWNGERWSAQVDKASAAAKLKCIRAIYQDKLWRGLAKPPKGGAA